MSDKEMTMQRHLRETSVGRLEVIESSGTGLTVFMCHGNSGCADDFKALLEGPLGLSLHLVAISLPGHGGSEWARDPMSTYHVAGFGAAVVQVIAAYARPAYGLLGQSLGGHVLLESLADLPGARGLLLLSAPPLSVHTLSQAFRPDPTGGALFSADLSAVQTEAWVQALVNTTRGPWADQVRQGLQQADPQMRHCLGLHLPQLQDERRLLDAATIPIALLAGSDDAFLHADYWDTLPRERMWGGKPMVCSGKPHALHLAAAEDVTSVLMALLANAMQDSTCGVLS
jgi:pimeloyl-ACP methyl ester carboxylesterase